MGAAEQRFGVVEAFKCGPQLSADTQDMVLNKVLMSREANMLQSSESNHTHVKMNAATISFLFFIFWLRKRGSWWQSLMLILHMMYGSWVQTFIC